MTQLWGLIEAHLDHYGVTSAAFARKCGTTSQTVANWRNGSTSLPNPSHLRSIAQVIGAPYEVVLNAALVDAGYRDEVVDNVVMLRGKLDAMAHRDNVALAAIAEKLAAQLGVDPPAEDDLLAARIEDDPKESK